MRADLFFAYGTFIIMTFIGCLILYYILKTAIKNGIKEALADKSVSINLKETVVDRTTN